ncbi:MAG TPA: carbamoyltransferase C-terminal domain-containing protein [Xanthobacteraceae bacterium]|nr:carbamoyltransferase C-terminal domain-containing protein [Xanthobacteraceae bacterium]
MNVLGLNAYHSDAAACLLRDGKLVAAAEEERFRRVKHWAGFPTQAIAYCLKEAGIGLADVTHVAINRNNRANFARKLIYVATARPSLKSILGRVRNRAQWAGVEEELQRAFPEQSFRGTVEHVEHHFAHLASAFYASPFNRAVAVSVDGFGDFASAAWGLGQNTEIKIDGRVLFPHSLGIFYQAMTQYIGFPNYGDEYKVMGLAPYGTPALVEKISSLVHLKADGTFSLNLDYFKHHRDEVEYEWAGGSPTFANLFSDRLEEYLGPRRSPNEALSQFHHDIAYATQAVFENAFFHLLNTLHAKYGNDALALSGGCANNSAANGKIVDRTKFRRVYIPAAAGDAGGAIGAAYAVWHRLKESRGAPLDHAYWGPGCDDAEIERLLSGHADKLSGARCDITIAANEPTLLRTVAKAISDGCVVGWFQGRMEWGPRALGNRSILGDPRRTDMKKILNEKIKRRESFRPFAPSVLRERVAAWFEHESDVPFMMQIYKIRAERQSAIPAVTHVDGTGRLQTVHQDTNPRYYALIEEFRRQTGVPMVLNTSFNENEPVVCRPEEALDCFMRTRMDMLVLGNYIITRTSSPAAATAGASKAAVSEVIS